MAAFPPTMAPDGADEQQQQVAPGTFVAKEGEDQPQSLYGPNNEQLEEQKPQLVSALKELVQEFRRQGLISRRHEIRRIRQARLFWQGLHYAWFNPNDMNWKLPFQSNTVGDDRSLEDMPRYQFVTNFYQGFGLSFISLVSQDVPTVRFWPGSAQNIEDITAAKAASDVVELEERLNKVGELLKTIGYYLWTDGKVGGYVRYVVDGERFGFSDNPTMEAQQSPIGEESYNCPSCGTETPAQSGAIPGQPPVCIGCGNPLTPDDMRPQVSVSVPNITGNKKIPNGREVITIVGGLGLHTPPWADTMEEFPFLQWDLEAERAKLIATHPHVEEKLKGGGETSGEDVYARTSRLTVQQGLPVIHVGDTLYDLLTYSRTWLRPWAFYQIQDKAVRDELLQLFPTGCYVAFAGATYCESRNESMEDHWKVMHALPGDGQSRPSVGDSLIQVQKQYNALDNIEAETSEYTIPPIYADPQTLDFDALSEQDAQPGSHVPARARPGQPLAASFFQPPGAEVPKTFVQRRQELIGPIAQFLTGLFPAMFGGNQEGAGGETAKGYEIARDQAIGRLGLIWRSMKSFYADLMMLTVDCFRKNRPEDVEMPILNAGRDYTSKFIRLADLKGSITAYPEPDETYPRLKSQQRNVIQSLLQAEDPMIESILSEPANIGQIKNLLGLSAFVIPNEDSRNKQLREIEELLKAEPIDPNAMLGDIAQANGGMGAPPLAGGPPAPLMSTVPVDPLLDNHAVEFEECKRWANSEAGQAAKMENPSGFANVRAHAEAHMRAMPPPPQVSAPQGADAVNGEKPNA